jgi:hypothetical protein
MGFSSTRGRPRTYRCPTDTGTPELRLKHALGLTAEPIDLCLTRGLINTDQHWCSLHLRWLYTLRYGAPNLTTRYIDRPQMGAPTEEHPKWREMREQEYQEAISMLKQQQRFEPVMRICVFNELPAFLSPALRSRARSEAALASQLSIGHRTFCEGLDILVHHWRRQKSAPNPSPNLL